MARRSASSPPRTPTRYVSAPTLHPPKITGGPGERRREAARRHHDRQLLRPHPAADGRPERPAVLGGNLQPIWFKPVPTNVVASNLEAQTYQGKPVLSWWQGDVTATGQINSGEDIVVNQHYQKIATIRGRDGWIPTLHEFVIRGHDAWVTANKNVPGASREVRRRQRRRGDRLGGPGVRPAHRQARIQLGRLQAHPAERLLRSSSRERLPLGRVPRQLGRPAQQRHVPGLDAQHLGHLPGRREDRQDRVDPRR